MIEKIVEGQINKFQKDVVLSKQPFVMDPDVTIEQLVANSAKELGSSNLHLAGVPFYCGAIESGGFL